MSLLSEGFWPPSVSGTTRKVPVSSRVLAGGCWEPDEACHKPLISHSTHWVTVTSTSCTRSSRSTNHPHLHTLHTLHNTASTHYTRAHRQAGRQEPLLHLTPCGNAALWSGRRALSNGETLENRGVRIEALLHWCFNLLCEEIKPCFSRCWKSQWERSPEGGEQLLVGGCGRAARGGGDERAITKSGYKCS